jgi:signal transduction histidine kinase/CHASE2 domain-containing sensor protein
MPSPPQTRGKLLSTVQIALLAAFAGVLAVWALPGLRVYADDWLMRLRGPLPVPPDIAIAAIDEKSVAAIGRFPWPRDTMAKAIDAISAAQPKVIAVDVLFTGSTTAESDDALAASLRRAGNAVLAAQLVDSEGSGTAAWLMPLPSFAAAAAGVGHANVEVEPEGGARAITARTADDHGRALWAIPIEAVRVAEGASLPSLLFTGRSVLVGGHTVPLQIPPGPSIRQSGTVERLRTGSLSIDYIGPAGSFAPITYSVSDLLQGAVPAAAFRGKYVLLGSTIASGADRFVSPFLHQTDARSDQHGVLMPGVNVLANAVNTILRSRFYTESGPWTQFFWAVIAALVTLAALDRSQGRWEAFRQGAVLFLLIMAAVLCAYAVFVWWLFFLPLVPVLTAIILAAIMGLLRRSLVASSELDAGLAELTRSSRVIAASTGPDLTPSNGWLPRGLEWKVERIRDLNARLIERAQLVDLALGSVEDGLIIAGPRGTIVFANRAAAVALNAAADALRGQDLFERLRLPADDLLRQLTVDRARLEREIEVGEVRPRRYLLRMAAVADEGAGKSVCAIVASLTDVTRQVELQRTKNDVIALVSHEMRTPLTAIQGLTELLAVYDIDAPRRKEISASINSEVKRLTAMTGDYLDITRLESGATPLRTAPVRIESVLQRTVLLLEPVAAQKQIRLTLNLDSNLPAVFADVELLGRALENLISNAIKYSPSGTEVAVSAAPEGENIALKVVDRGYGIPQGDKARIFDKFYRVQRAEDAGVPGTGLGLAFVREIAEMHGGRVLVDSTLGQGSTFTLLIPVAKQYDPDSKLN